MFARVIVDMHHPEVDRVFDYHIPVQLLADAAEGVRVIVPFGRMNTKTEGYILSLAPQAQIPPEKIKDILEILDHGQPVFTPPMLRLAEWMKERYFCTLNQCLQVIMPAGIRTKSEWYVCLQENATQSTITKAEAPLIALLEEHGEMSQTQIEHLLGQDCRGLLLRLRKKGVVKLRQRLQRATYKNEKRFFSLQKHSPLLPELLQRAETDRRRVAQRRLFALLADGAEHSHAQLRDAGIAETTIKTMMEKGVLTERIEEQRRSVFRLEEYEATPAFHPTQAQAFALSQIAAALASAEKKPILLHGITGSGKTEVYMQSIACVLEMGRQAVVLVPEISLTPQTMARFISRFGSQVSVTHSRLSAGERLDQWKKAAAGEISVIIGPRSALFMPFPALGMIIIDEVHENSYISDTTPRYDARETAEQLAEQTGAALLMGSATPDLVRYHKALTGEYHLLRLEERTGGGELPKMLIADMRSELAAGNRSVFSRALQEEIHKNLRSKEQTILFLNRRGYATFVSCRSCGHVMTCPDCGIAYTYHTGGRLLLCHHCGRRQESPRLCPSCGSKYIRYFGTGTQRIEEEARRLFPDAGILRMDLDTTGKKGSHSRILEQFQTGAADILIGTQMIAKGHDFPNVTLVGIMAADTSLHTGGFYGAENTFQLITQAGGRAGRRDARGRVYIQTYQPEHYSIRHAAAQDYAGFYEEEILFRQLMDYPPFGSLLSIMVSGREETAVQLAAAQLAELLRQQNTVDTVTVMGAVPDMVRRLRGEYRYRIILQAKQEEVLREIAVAGVAEVKKTTKKDVYFNLTLNPHNIV